MASVEQASAQSSPRAGRRLRLVAGTGLAAAAPTALFGWALNEYLYELKWLDSSSGWLDGDPDLSVLAAGTVGLILLAVVTFGTYRRGVRQSPSGELSPRQALACALAGAGIPLVLLALVLLTWAGVSPLTSVLRRVG